jgi:hypothetical protein
MQCQLLLLQLQLLQQPVLPLLRWLLLAEVALMHRLLHLHQL